MQLSQAEITQLDDNNYRISGKVDFSTVPYLTQRVSGFFKTRSKSAAAEAKDGLTVTTDMSEITDCNSAGLALLLEMYKLGRLHNIRLRFINLPSPLLTIAKAYGIEREIRAICR